MRFYIGLDLGQAQDYTAVTVLERLDLPTGGAWIDGERKTQAHYHARHLERFRLGTSYPAIVARVKVICESEALRGDYELIADATGVGRPVIDLLRAADLSVRAVTITGGDKATEEAGEWHTPKRDLISTLQVLLQNGRLKFAEGLPEVATLTSELLTYQVKITQSANDTYNAREGAHDDMVLALALAAWYAEQCGKIQFWF